MATSKILRENLESLYLGDWDNCEYDRISFDNIIEKIINQYNSFFEENETYSRKDGFQ